tara:strand:+ start:62 stop:469 length:408 start_codon:yes stop_codon:yes gene_type:complete
MCLQLIIGKWPQLTPDGWAEWFHWGFSITGEYRPIYEGPHSDGVPTGTVGIAVRDGAVCGLLNKHLFGINAVAPTNPVTYNIGVSAGGSIRPFIICADGLPGDCATRSSACGEVYATGSVATQTPNYMYYFNVHE